MQEKLIFDLGMHLAQDTAYYLSLGYRVVAVDASPQMINSASEKFRSAYDSGQLLLLNYAISDNSGEVVDFHLSEKSEWNSLYKNISIRQGHEASIIKVETIALSDLIKKYGVPYYCKIDIEGFDHLCIKSLKKVSAIPKYISCETECLSENEQASEEKILETLHRLKEVGYKKFKLIDQQTLCPLRPYKPFYLNQKKSSVPIRTINKFLRQIHIRMIQIPWRERLSVANGFDFTFGSTGPFGEQAPGVWMDFESSKNCLLYHREAFFKLKTDYPLYTIWCDWHATY